MAINIVFNKFNKIHRNACATLVINLTNASWAGDINFSNMTTDDIKPHKI